MKWILCILLFCASLHAELALEGFAIRYAQGNLRVLNQQKLPQEEEWIDVQTPQEMAEIITSLKVRGAPMVGIAAVLSLTQLAEQGASQQTLLEAAALLKSSRPTAVNLATYIERTLASMQKHSNFRQAVIDTAEEIYNEDSLLCQQIGLAGAQIIEEGEHILTICNTGSLTTAGIGTALGVIKTAHTQGKKNPRFCL